MKVALRELEGACFCFTENHPGVSALSERILKAVELVRK
jgi:hypothetical protein